MLIKTPEFNKRFINDLSKIIFESKLYYEILKRDANIIPDYNYFFENKKLFNNVNFVGSFPGKKYNEIISDIDVVQIVKINNNFILRLQQIIKTIKTPGSNFKFIRFYCGSREYLKMPWVIDDKGDCNFSLDNAYIWTEFIRPYIPADVYMFIYSKIIGSDTLSVKDLIEVEKIMEPYISISWTEDDIINGYKVDTGIQYNLLDTLQKNKNKNVIKFLYVYKNEGVKEYCFVDMSLKNRDLKTTINTERLYSYYLNDSYKKFKGLKFNLPEKIKHNYRSDMANKIGHLIILYSNIELINKVSKYNINNRLIGVDDMNKLIAKVAAYASTHRFNIDLSAGQNIAGKLKEAEHSLNQIISHESDIFYTKYRKLVTDNYHLKMIIFDEIRAEDGAVQINKNILHARIQKGIKCPFFLLSGSELEKLISIALTNNINPFKFVKCIIDISINHKKTPSSVVNLLFSNQQNLTWLINKL